MEIHRKVSAGTLESSDVFVEVSPAAGRQIHIESVVMEQFGDQLHSTVEDLLDQFGITNVEVALSDRGALECTVRARVEAALKRGGQLS